ncbi:MAG: DUF721 domain-containing protein [Deltaproteobacteria bacterium]|nr:DUF721 domain-containing protein [Deltaproteobacteria bacterium]
MAKKFWQAQVPAKKQTLRRKQKVVAVGEVVGGLLDTPQLRERLLHENIFRQWRKIVGGGLLDKCQPTRIKRNILYLDVKNSSWAHQLIYLQEEIISRVNASAGRTLISAIHCRVVKAGPLQAREEPAAAEKLSSAALVSEAEALTWRRQTEALVRDPELIDILCRMRCHCVARQRLM